MNIYDGADRSAIRIARLHGSRHPTPRAASGATMLVEFTSDGSVARDGFLAAFSCGQPAPPPPPPAAATLACTGGTVMNGTGYIDFYNGHAHNADCRWLAVCPANRSPVIRFTEFHTEARYDFVNV